MAVDSKQGVPTNGANGLAGAIANGQLTKGGRKRPSSLMQTASSLPTVEHSLDEFIAKANQTLVDVSQWGNAEKEAKAEDDKRREQDAQRMKAAESQLREGVAREQSLRRQLDGLQGKLAEAEARAAVAAASSGQFPAQGNHAAQDAAIEALRAQIAQAEAQRATAEAQKQQIAAQLAEAQAEAATARTTMLGTGVTTGVATELPEDATERIRVAEAKATKALAAARAAQAGLSVSPADLAAIESGLVAPAIEKKGTPWVAIAVAFVVGLGLMAVLWKVVLDKPAAAPAQPVAAPAPAAQPAVAPPTQPTVTPIVEPAAKVDDTAAADKAAADKAAADQAAADKAAADQAAADQAAADKAAAAEKAAADKAASKKASTRKASTRKTSTKKATSSGGLADPFATPAPKKPTKPAAKKPAGGIVDPF